MSLYCSISNEVPEIPVISPVSGHIFEKRIIVKYISEFGCDPINNQELKVDDLIEVKTQNVTKPVSANVTSVPAILKMLQDEWDAVMLHSFTLRQQLQTARQELSRTLYQHDAACRTIARLHKENLAAREVLANLKPETVSSKSNSVSNGNESSSEKQVDKVGMTAEIIKKLQENATVLTRERKTRGKTVPADFTTPNELETFKLESSHPGLHSASLPGITTLDVHNRNSHRILTGGNDKNAVVFDALAEEVLATLKGHTKKVTRVVYHTDENRALTASADGTVRVWDVSKAETCLTLRCHESAVTGLSLHPTGDFALTCSDDHSWAFSDICDGRLITKVFDAAKHELTAAQFHPDGLIFGVGTADSQVKIWDIQEQSNVANFPGHSGPISAIAFSENGYYLATAADDACIKLWDLRKLKNFKTIPLSDKYEIRDLRFDQTGAYLAVAGNDLRVYLCKQWSEMVVFGEHMAVTTGVRFGHNAKFLASTSMDRSLKIYGNLRRE